MSKCQPKPQCTGMPRTCHRCKEILYQHLHLYGNTSMDVPSELGRLAALGDALEGAAEVGGARLIVADLDVGQLGGIAEV
jgi:hypothetical protein